MPVNVYGWPPVGAVSTMWTFDQPSSRSVSGLTGSSRYSLIKPERRQAKVVVAALARERNGAGYSEVLKRLLKGRSNLVRLYSSPINWHLDALAEKELRQGAFFTWETGSFPLAWVTGSDPVAWFSGAFLNTVTIGTSLGFPAITVSGLPPSTMVARPGEFVTLFENAADDLEAGVSIMVMSPAQSNASGVAVIRLYSTPPYADRVSIGAAETAVFRAVSVPSSEQPFGANWTLPWEFSEVFSSDVGGFTEVQDWWAET